MKHKLDNKGVSLAITIGLLLLLVTLTTTINELVIRALRASHQIEASDKAYFAAEAGVENALYELSAYYAGYQTPALGSADARRDDFNGSVKWSNEWEIAGRGLNRCSDMASWLSYSPRLCGRIYENEKIVINIFSDDTLSTDVGINGINENSSVVNAFNLNSITPFQIRFRLPPSLIAEYPGAFLDSPYLKIDNDGDYNPLTGSGLNEDGDAAHGYLPAPCPYSGGIPVNDNDCDGREDEDSPQDPVFLWKVTDEAGHSFTPLRGCKGESPPHPSHPLHPNAILCESTFTRIGNEVTATLRQDADYGINQDGIIQRLAAFLTDYASYKPQLEILPAIPFKTVDPGGRNKILIPYFEYGISYLDHNESAKELPSTYFSIRSDGYYQDFKQSITTNVLPKTTTRLLDLTIIQQ